MIARLAWTARKARALMVHALALMVEYRAEVVIWLISGTLPLIMMFVWIGLAADGPVGGFDAADFAAYFLGIFVVQRLIVTWVVWDLDRDIRLGELSPKLLRPIDPIWQYAASNLAQKVLELPLLAAVMALGLWLAGASIPWGPSLLAFPLTLALAWTIRFCQQYSAGLIAFWTDQATGVESVWYALYWGLSGTLAPLALFPDGLARWIAFTPFPYMADFPVRVLLGRATGPELVWGLLAQAGWALVFVGLRGWLWRRGLRRYGAVGA